MKKWLIAGLLVCLTGAGAYFWWGLTGVRPLHENRLTFSEVRQVTIRDTISATGMVEPREIVIVSSKMPGQVVHIADRAEKRSIPLNIGDLVLEGADLAQLDDREIVLKLEEAKTGVKLAKAAIKQAEAALEQAKANKLAADRNLAVQKSVEKIGFRAEREQAEALVDAAAAGIKVAEAGIQVVEGKKEAADTALDEAKLAHTMTRLRVPTFALPGAKQEDLRKFLILDRKVNVGQMVGPQSGPLFTLAGNLDVVEVHAQVVEGDVNKVGATLKAYFKVNNYSDDETEFEGIVESIHPLANNIKGAAYCNAVIRVQNRKEAKTGDWLLRRGMTVPVDIVRVEKKNAWRMPSAALNFSLEEAYQSDAAKARLADWKRRPDFSDWRPLWVWDDASRQAQPIFVRILAKPGEVALKDAEGNEILEWEPGKTPTGPLRVITGAPPARPPGFFDQPANVKI